MRRRWVRAFVLAQKPGQPGTPATIAERPVALCTGFDAFAEKFVAGSPDLGIRGTMPDGDTITLREVLVHMIEEYARHCGHADLLRERIDGRVGQ